MWSAEENRLLGVWNGLEPGSAMRLKVGNADADVFRHTTGWHLMIPLAGTQFDARLISYVEQHYPGYHLLLIQEQCYLHKRYGELTSQILTDIHSLAERLETWSY